MSLQAYDLEGWCDLSRDVRREVRRRELQGLLVRPFRSLFAVMFRLFVVAIAIVSVLKVSLVEAFFVPTSSMTPTLRAHDYILVPKFLYGLRLPLLDDALVSWGRPERGDVIVFNRARPTLKGSASEAVVKRVIGVENDLVEIRGGDVLVNGAGLVEPYVTRGSEAADTTYHFGPLKVPKGKVFVLGDNRANSEDSRMWSEPFVPLSQIIGKAVMVYWSSAQDSPVRTVL